MYAFYLEKMIKSTKAEETALLKSLNMALAEIERCLFLEHYHELKNVSETRYAIKDPNMSDAIVELFEEVKITLGFES